MSKSMYKIFHLRKSMAEDKQSEHYWADQILKFGPNTEAREELISKMAERLDRIENLAPKDTAHSDLIRLLFNEVNELRSVVDQLFKLLTTDKPRKR